MFSSPAKIPKLFAVEYCRMFSSDDEPKPYYMYVVEWTASVANQYSSLQQRTYSIYYSSSDAASVVRETAIVLK